MGKTVTRFSWIGNEIVVPALHRELACLPIVVFFLQQISWHEIKYIIDCLQELCPTRHTGNQARRKCQISFAQWTD
jgi:hypothetical protein